MTHLATQVDDLFQSSQPTNQPITQYHPNELKWI